MAITFNLPIARSVAGDLYTYESLTVTLRINPYSSTTYTGSHTADGVYTFANVTRGDYKVYASGVEQTQFGIIRIGDPDAVGLTGDETIAGVKTFSGTSVIVTNDLTVGDDLAVTDDATIGGDFTVTGASTLIGTLTFGNATVTGDIALDTGSFITGDDPVSSRQLANKNYVDDQVASIVVSPFQYSDNERYVITNGTVEASKVYTAIQTAIDSCTSPTTQNEFSIYLRRGGSVSTGTGYDNIFYVAQLELESHVNIIGYGIKTRLVMGSASDSASSTKTMSVENCSVFWGVNDITTARTYNSYTFKNCNIYAWHNVTFTACKLHNCNVFQPNGKGVTISGASEILGCNFTNTVTDGGTGMRVFNDGLNTSYTMPDDLSLSA